MAASTAAFLAACALVCASGVRIQRAPPAGGTSQDCPYGYGDGCENFWDDVGAQAPGKDGKNEGKLDPATKAQLQNILGGIISNLQHHPVKGLVQVSQELSTMTAKATANEQVAKALGSLVSALRREGKGAALLSRLSGTKVDEAAAYSTADVIALLLKSPYDKCPFGYGCGGGGYIDSATKAQVANILKGMIKSLGGKRNNLVEVSQDVSHTFAVHDPKNAGVKKALGSLLATMRRVGTDGKVLVKTIVGDEVQAGTAGSVQGVLADMLKSPYDKCPFGYGCGGGGTIDAATKSKVAGILKGMIKNLGGKKKE